MSCLHVNVFFFQFVTRAVRVIDLITNLDMAAFQSHAGLAAFINRLEVIICQILSLIIQYWGSYLAWKAGKSIELQNANSRPRKSMKF